MEKYIERLVQENVGINLKDANKFRIRMVDVTSILYKGVNDEADQETNKRVYLLCDNGKGFWEILVK